MRIIYIRPAREKDCVRVGVECDGEKRELFLTERAFAECGSFSAGDSLTQQAFDALVYADSVFRAQKKALNILAYGDNSERVLTQKLARAGFDREIVSKTVLKMKSLGYLNDRTQIEKLVLREANERLFGPRKIISRLVQKGYSASEVREVISELEEKGEIDFSASAKRLARAKLSDPSDSEERKKLLYKNGYNVC